MASSPNPLDELEPAASPSSRGRMISASNALDELEPKPGPPPGVLESIGRGFSEGLTFGYDDRLGLSKERREQSFATNPVSHFAGELAGSVPAMVAASFIPAAGEAADASRTAQLASRAGQVAKTLLTPTPAKEGAGLSARIGNTLFQGGKLGTTYGAISGAGHADVSPDDTFAQSAEKQLSGAVGGAEQGLVAGPAIGLAAHGATGTASLIAKGGSQIVDAVSPTFARWAANGNAILRKTLGYPQPYEAGAIGGREGSGAAIVPPTVEEGIPPTTDPGTRAQALQILANTWRRENVSVDDVEQALAKAAEARRLNSNSYAQDVQALADVTPGTQRLAGALYRASPETANRAIDFTYARQTGLIPDRGLPENSGLPAIEKFAPPMTGADALEQYGSQFDTSLKGTVPTGLYARVRRAFMRANEISDEDYHGHAATASRTDEAILDAAQADAKTDYAAANAAGQGTDIRPAIAPILQKWWQAADEYPGLAGAQIKKAVAQFLRSRDATPPPPIPGRMMPAEDFTVNGRHPFATFDQFDKAKQALDDQIGKLLRGGDSYAGGVVLTPLKNELLAAVDGIDKDNPNGLGPLYQTARGKFAGRMQEKRMLQAGRDSLADPDAGIDAFRSAGDDKGSQKLFRLGQIGAFEKKYGGQPVSADVLKFFDSPNVMSLLSETLPASERESATFADRPKRFGRYLATERQMLTTPRKVIGGSPTAERLADDAALDSMNALVEQFHGTGAGMLKTPMSNMTWEGMGMQAVSHVLNKFFGYRADSAAELGKMLFTADPATRARVLSEVRQRMGQDRFSYFASLMQQALRNSVPARGAAAATEATVGTPSPQGRP